MTNKEKVTLYLDYLNNYLSVNTFALNKGLTFNEAVAVISEGRELNEELAQKSNKKE